MSATNKNIPEVLEKSWNFLEVREWEPCSMVDTRIPVSDDPVSLLPM